MRDNNYHIIPVNDWKEHKESPDCWCKPSRSLEEETVIIHNSLDGREVQELRNSVADA